MIFLFRHVFSLFAVSLLLATLSAHADEIKLKNGETISGRITYEDDNIVKIEVEVSNSIKETKILGRDQIAELIKDAPDDVAFGELQDLLPTPSLMPASAYRSAIQTGPEAFLRSFPDSQHAEKVQEMKTILEEELDLVERGFIKLEDDWISPADQREFEALTKSRIRLLNMKKAAATRNYNGYINAMREYEVLEERYFGTPAFTEGLELAREIIPALGRQLQSMLRDVEYRNQQYEKNLAAMDEIAREQVKAAREAERKSYEAGVDADKDAGISWVRLDPRSKPAIEDYLQLAARELKRIREEFELESLRDQAEMLVEADELAVAGDMAKARSTLREAASLTGEKIRSRSSRKKSDGSYLASINAKISALEEEEKARREAREEAAESEALTANLQADEQGDQEAEEKSEEDQDADGEEKTDADVDAEEEEKPQDAFSALASTGKKGDDDSAKSNDSRKSDEKKSSRKEEDEKRRDEKEEEEQREESREPVAVDPGGGFPFIRIVQIVTGLLLITVVALKFFGKKDE